MQVADIRIADYDYPLPEERIAKFPLEARDECLLLHCGRDGALSHRRFLDLPELLAPGTLLAANNTKVINARIRLRKPTGAEIEVMLLDPEEPADYNLTFQSRDRVVWKCMVGNLKRWKSGSLELPIAGGTLRATLAGEAEGNARLVELAWDTGAEFGEVIAEIGRIPIPPYLRRDSQESDSRDYQTLFAKIRGSVAAPTAGLHFTDRVVQGLERRGVERAEVTLHVGAGTFLPVKSETIGGHPMHTEVFTVGRPLVESLLKALAEKRPIAAVGTTTVRTLESLPWLGKRLAEGREPHVSQWEAYEGEAPDTASALKAILEHMDARGADSLTASTSIMIAPGFRWSLVDTLVTNFHQPQSTLLLLVSSFLGEGRDWRAVYDEALARDYRFLSYGDACIFER